MSNHQRPLVNQRLYFCRLHLDWLGEQLRQQVLAKKLVEQALGESIIHHLVLAYRAYLEEIAVAYNLTPAPFNSAGELIDALADEQQASAEAQEWLLLEEAKSSWLSALRRLHSAQSVAPAVASRRSSEAIVYTELDPAQSVDLPLLEGFYQALHDLISRQRNQLEEW